MGRPTRIASYRSHRKRSAAQQNQTRRIIPRVGGSPEPNVDQENRPIPQSEAHVWKKQSAEYKKQILNVRRRADRAKKALAEVRTHTKAIQLECSAACVTNAKLETKLEDSSELIRGLRKRNHSLAMRLRRMPGQKARAVQNALSKNGGNIISVKEKGVVKDQFRDLVLDLVSEGVGVEHVNPIVKRVSKAFGVEVDGDISTRSVSRIVLEGGVASKMQIVEHIQRASSLTYSGDGTTHKNNNYESRHLHVMDGNGGKQRLFMGVHSAVNHTSETQISGLQTQVEDLYSTYNHSTRAITQPADSRSFAVKLRGVNTDHAADQKRLAQLLREWKTKSEREIRGEQSLLAMTPERVLPLLFEATERSITAAGGLLGWEALSEEEKGCKNKETYQEICQELGQQEFDKLSDSAKEAIDWFVWCGCCMHKELNTVKGGNARMVKWWDEQNIPGPIKLMNRDNAAAVHLGGAAGSRAAEVSQGGAVKATSLAGAVFRHKDDKKGQQDSLKFFFEDAMGYTISFPDTSNTRYQSHCEAASELLVHLELYKQFLDVVKDKKESRSLNHMEQNVYAALTDPPTLHELCILALFSQSVSHPYMRNVRGPGQADLNVLDMGPLHADIHTFIKRVINDPDILLSPEATYLTASFDRKPWDRPETFYAIQRMAPELPHLRGVLVAFFEGASETWARFTQEYSPGGVIASATPAFRQAAWMPTTNDANEGALGSYRVAKRRYPSISQHQLNARTCYKRNRTSSYIQGSLNDLDRKHLRKQARVLDAQALEKKRHHEQVSYDKAVVERKHSQDKVKQGKKNAAAAKVAAVTPVLDINQITHERFTNTGLDLQLEWHRQFSSDIAKKKDVLTKALKLQALKNAVQSFLDRKDTEEASKDGSDGRNPESDYDSGEEL